MWEFGVIDEVVSGIENRWGSGLASTSEQEAVPGNAVPDLANDVGDVLVDKTTLR